MRISGTVVSFLGTFGFIARADKLPDIFFTGTALTRSGLHSLDRLQRVEFDAVENPRMPGRLMAENIKIVGSAR